jgi:hypothetical protein
MALNTFFLDQTENDFIYSMSDDKFLSWFYNRVITKHKESTIIIDRLKNIFINNRRKKNNKIPSPEFIEKMCEKYYPDFHMGKDNDLKWGYTAREKENIREFIKNLYMDTIEYIK